MSEPATRWIRAEVRALSAYHVPPAFDGIKLDAMENPYAWPGELSAAWQARLADVAVNRYPDPQATALKQRLRATMGIARDAGLILGNGSDELIQILALAVAGPETVVLAPGPSFVMYRMIAQFAGMRYVEVPLGENFELDLDAMLAAIAEHRPALTFLAWPNNPTGNLFAVRDVERIIEASPGLVVVDEAYAPFAQTSLIGRAGRPDRLLVMRTLSKLGLAGLRLGYMAGDAALIGELDKLRLPYNINVLTQASAEFALDHQRALDEQAALIRDDRERLFADLARVPGMRVWPSRANFLLFRTPTGQARAIFDALRAAGVLIKNLDGSHPRLADCLRVTVGTPAQNAAFIEALEAAIG
ncbi:MAG: histidinol-phosphate transaminase [Chromatiales bacterium]|nr:histidinol-phosphate transaminase [Chromatiales bacterium]